MVIKVALYELLLHNQQLSHLLALIYHEKQVVLDKTGYYSLHFKKKQVKNFYHYEFNFIFNSFPLSVNLYF